MKVRLHRLLACWLMTFAAHATQAQALDPSFQPITLYTPAAVTAAVPQPDGKRLVVGNFGRTDAGGSTFLVRYNANNTVDQAFATTVAGLQVTSSTTISNVRVLPSGKLLLVGDGTITFNGVTRQDLMLLNADGTLDASFDAGMASGTGLARASAVQADGKILLGGTFASYNGVVRRNLVRLLASGAVDTSFDPGTVFNTTVADITLQPDGRILVGGSFDAPAGVARLLATGALDASFASPFTTSAAVTMVGLQPDGKILLGGELKFLNNTNLSIGRLLTNGAQDPSFSDNAGYRLSITNRNDVTDFVVQPSGKIVVPLTYSLYQTKELVARFNPDGTPDATFSAPRSLGSVNSLQQQPNGQLLVGGSSFMLPNRRGSVVLLAPDGAIDADFNPLLLRSGSLQSIVQQPDGKVLAAGVFDEVNGVRANNIARFNTDGSLDVSFAATTNPLLSTQKIVLQPDGKVLAVGQAAGTNNSLVRLLPNGSLDNTWVGPQGVYVRSYVTQFALRSDGRIYVTDGFGVDLLLATGQTSPDFYPFEGGGHIVALLPLPDGKLLIGGAGQLGPGPIKHNALMRLQANGLLDPTFSSPIQSVPDAYVEELRLQPDGKIVVGGLTNTGYPSSLPYGLFRLLPTGAADNTFTPNLPTNGAFGWVEALALQPNGRILVGAYGNGLLRKMPDGSADATFGNAGVNSDIEDIILQPDGKILIAGYFNMVSGQATTGLARLTAPNVLHVRNSQLEARTQAWPVPAHEALNLTLDAAAQPESVQLLDNLGRAVLRQEVTQAELTLPLRKVKAGVYLLRVNYAAGPVTRRVVVE
ncbi:T9SS type A sorting domain-containing protein [Hymenobacter aquaticus]|nr:T9SS type A sorting domain-containing protein [Hymenobacter aquaticus]